MLESSEDIKDALPIEQQQLFDYLKTISTQHERKPFLYIKSLTSEKTVAQEGFSVLTLNTCFLPGNLSLLLEALYHWELHVGPLASKILSVDADIICLQEVYTEEASYALYEKLKGTYTHFYAAIGPRPFGFSLQTLGLPSGLFVASKYAVENPQFTLFSKSGFPMNYGVFDFIVKIGSTPIGHVYTTHMQSLNYEQFDEIRFLQLQQILEKMQRDRQDIRDRDLPFFLCGDLNIGFGSQEPAEMLICKHFLDDYNKNQSAINEVNSTCTEYFSNYVLSQTKDPLQIKPNFGLCTAA